jgi:LysR family glycine cleavage system transcriptional activator
VRKHLPSLNQLRAFEATARHLSFSAAAEELFVTHAAVSHQVKALEDFLQTRLFDRMTRSIKLTDEAHDYYQDAKKALDIIEIATSRFFENRVSGALKISAAPSFATRWLLPRLNQFKALYPDIEVQLIPSIEVSDFQKSDLDIAIRHGKGRWPGVKSIKLFDELLVPVASPDYFGGLDLAEVLSHTLLSASPRKKEWPEWINNQFGKSDRKLDLVFFPTQALALDAAVSGTGIALADKHLIASDVLENRLIILHDKSIWNILGFYVSFRKGPVVEAKVKVFCEWITTQIK